jgi:hypothetical protein
VSHFCGVYPWLQDEIIIKSQWSHVIRKSTKTLNRWEDEIINSKPQLKYWFWKGRKNKYGYDSYQRLITLIIRELKDGHHKTNQEVINWFYQNYKFSGVPIWKLLSRTNFIQFMEKNNESQRVA